MNTDIQQFIDDAAPTIKLVSTLVGIAAAGLAALTSDAGASAWADFGAALSELGDNPQPSSATGSSELDRLRDPSRPA